MVLLRSQAAQNEFSGNSLFEITWQFYRAFIYVTELDPQFLDDQLQMDYLPARTINRQIFLNLV